MPKASLGAALVSALLVLSCGNSRVPSEDTGIDAGSDSAVDLTADAAAPDLPPDAAKPTCTDGIKNALETDTDCGGNACFPCAAGKKCLLRTDCASGMCTAGVCAAATCTDKVKNGQETDADCGGGTCPSCANGKQCKAKTDCASKVCAGNVCAYPACGDGVKNGSETDADCGGGCSPCADGKQCSSSKDCSSGVCFPAIKICGQATCSDWTRNGKETDIDCGGPTCPSCANGKQCTAKTDCASGVCQGSVCAYPMCNDGAKNGSETDTDCGGFACQACATGKKCLAGYDCASKVCSSATNTCAAATCADGVANSKETDIDCGGSCPACAAGKACKQAADCGSLYCAKGICKTPTCKDKVKNGSETDVDCGGVICSGCVDGKQCVKGTDCVSGVCSGGACQMPTCKDKVKNGSETDVDCGGQNCPLCAGGKGCKTCSDCGSMICAGGTCSKITAASCAKIKAACPAAKSGLYFIDLNGGSANDAFAAQCDMTTAGGGWTRCASIIYKADKSTALYGVKGQSIGGDTKDSYFGAGGTAKLKQQCFDLLSGEVGFMLKHDDEGKAAGGPYDYVYAWKFSHADLTSTLKFSLVTGSGSSQLTDVKATMLVTPVTGNPPLCLDWGDGNSTYVCYKAGQYRGTSRGLWMATTSPVTAAKQTWVEISDTLFDRMGVRDAGQAIKRDGVMDLFVR